MNVVNKNVNNKVSIRQTNKEIANRNDSDSLLITMIRGNTCAQNRKQ